MKCPFTAEAGWSWKVQGGWQFDATPNVNSVLVALSNHKYHSFGDNEYFFDNYYQGNYFRLFSRHAAYSTSRFAAVSNVEYWHQTNLVWTAWSAGEAGVKALLDGREETGMDVAHANRKFRFIVNAATGCRCGCCTTCNRRGLVSRIRP